MGKRDRPRCSFIAAILISVTTTSLAGPASNFNFKRDTLTFPNWTVWNYANGLRVSEPASRGRREKTDRYTRRCFVMSRTVEQFFKFARFDPKSPILNDDELARRVRQITHRPPWHPALPPNERIVFPGYANLRQLSKGRTRVLQNNIGLGWPTYARVGNFRMFFLHTHSYQEKMHQAIEDALAGQDFLVAYLSDFPILHINHSVLVYARKKRRSADGIDRYWVYDPNHPDGPRELTWVAANREFHFEKDPEFPGGYTRVYQIYGKPLQ